MEPYIDYLDDFQALMYPDEYFDPVEVLSLIDALELAEFEEEICAG